MQLKQSAKLYNDVNLLMFVIMIEVLFQRWKYFCFLSNMVYAIDIIAHEIDPEYTNEFVFDCSL